MNSTSPQYWIDFLREEYALAKNTNERTWQAIPYSLSKDEYAACVVACEKLGFKRLKASSQQRYLKVDLRRTASITQK